MNKALLDTDTLSELGKAVDPNVARNGADYLALHGRYTLTVISVMEVVRGLVKKQAAKQLGAFLSGIPSVEVLSFDQAAAELAGHIQGQLERVGLPIGRADPMIAAIALTHGLELVTGNTAHYQRIQRLGHPIALRDWRA